MWTYYCFINPEQFLYSHLKNISSILTWREFLSMNTRNNSYLYSPTNRYKSCPLWATFSWHITRILLAILRMSHDFNHETLRQETLHLQWKCFQYLSQVYDVEENFPLQDSRIFLRTITPHLNHLERKTQQTGQ